MFRSRKFLCSIINYFKTSNKIRAPRMVENLSFNDCTGKAIENLNLYHRSQVPHILSLNRRDDPSRKLFECSAKILSRMFRRLTSRRKAQLLE